MQEIKKSRIVIASVLKPVDDTRMFEKMALTLADPSHEVHIIGYPSIRKHEHAGVVFHPLNSFGRISLARILASWKIAGMIVRIRPRHVIITTHELLIPVLIFRMFAPYSVIYDIRENYYRNIGYTNTFPPGIRQLIAGYVRLKEKILAPFIDHFLLAEKGYVSELTFLPARRTVIENKLKKPDESTRHNVDPGKIQLLFSGTLAETTGVFTAIGMAKKLHALDNTIHLTLIGYCAQKETLRKIHDQISPVSFIKLIGGDVLVPHDDIIQAIQHSDFGIIAYPLHTSTMNSIPTKLYEYLGYHLPILLINHPPWVERCKPYHAAIPFADGNVDPESLLHAIRSGNFYSVIPNDVFWENEEIKLKNVISSLPNPI